MRKGIIKYNLDMWLNKKTMVIESEDDTYYIGYVFNKYGKVYVEVPVKDVEVLN
ncbi:MAG TPA: hypothetical protein PK584_08115 [Fervidobacterium sp.]|nr:hypothetical protein [Fervidobacterium sp.]